MATSFSVHWDWVEEPLPQVLALAPLHLLAVWPAPVNPDACFEAAGFTDFEDQDSAWDSEAEALLHRVVNHLSQLGTPSLHPPPQAPPVPWFRRFFTRKPRELSLMEAVELPLHWDSLPMARIDFGAHGVSLRTGQGHFLLWVTLPTAARQTAESLLQAAAARHPVRRTHLHWRHLVPSFE